MDKYEYKIKVDEIDALIAKKKYADAMEIADSIDWRRVKSVMMLCKISDLYKINKRFEESRDLLLLAYDRHPGARSIVYSLCELSIKMGDLEEAVEFYKEFVEVAPQDSGKFVLRYKLFEAQDVSLEERIQVLEEYKATDYVGYTERWAYELAYLYHRVGMESKCVEECDELILCCAGGKYALKAMELKMLHQPLTDEQQEQYRVAKSPDIEVKMEVGQYDAISMQKELAQNMKEIMAPEGQVAEVPGESSLKESGEDSRQESDGDSSLDAGETKVITDVKEALARMQEDQEAGRAVREAAEDETETKVEEVFFGETADLEDMMKQVSVQPDIAELQEPQESHELQESQTVQEPLKQAEEKVPETEIREESLEEQFARYQQSAQDIPKGFEKILGMGYDGQISLLLPETEEVEKQITGQIRLDDVLLEWERMKKESEQKRQEAVRQRVLEQTGPMFTEFEAAMRDGLLEQLESGKVELPVQEEIDTAVQEPEEEEIVQAEFQTVVQEETVEEPIQEEQAEYQELTEEDQVEEIEEILEPEELEEKEAQESVEEPAEEPEEEPKEEPKEDVKAKQQRVFSPEEEELFGAFSHTEEAKAQIFHAIDNISMASYTGNVIITGKENMDAMTLAKNLVKEIKNNDSNFSGKIAKISASSLNKKDLVSTLDQLTGGALIVQKASEMNGETAEKLRKALDQEGRGIIVLLLDTKKAMNKFLSANRHLEHLFNIRVDVEPLSNDALVACGKKYALEQEYSIDEMGVLALHTTIADRQTSDHAVTIAEVQGIVDDAIRHANRKTLGHFFDLLVARRYDEEDMIIIREKDFV